jgi:hypothetical protein
VTIIDKISRTFNKNQQHFFIFFTILKKYLRTVCSPYSIANSGIISHFHATYFNLASKDNFNTKQTYHLESIFDLRSATIDVPTNVVVQYNHKSGIYAENKAGILSILFYIQGVI